ncbi:MAG TPA: hypothetical protein VGO62_10195, partial [Myxococcota bacterium]
MVLALAPIIALPQLIGGVLPVLAVPASGLELLALVLLVIDRARAGARIRASVLAVPLLLGLALTLFEITPLPGAIVRALQPVGAENVAWVTSLLHEGARASIRSVLSLDPPETAFAAVRLIGALALLLVVTETCRKHRARSLAFRFLLASGILMFAVALGHQLLHINGAWGRFTMKTTFFYAPMVNPNQLARVFGAISLACVARSLTVRSRLELAWFLGGGIACGAAVFLTLSRGAMVAYAAGALVLGALLLRDRKSGTHDSDDHDESGGSFAPLALGYFGVVAAIGLGLFLAQDTIVREAASLGGETIESSKLALYQPALALVPDYGRVGVGNYAFGVAFMQHAS